MLRYYRKPDKSQAIEQYGKYGVDQHWAQQEVGRRRRCKRDTDQRWILFFSWNQSHKL